MRIFNFSDKLGHFNFFIGLTLIVFGGLFLLSNYGVIPAVEWNKIWPLILVLLGLTFLFRGPSNFSREKDSSWL